MIANAPWQQALRRAVDGDQRAVLVVVATTAGSTPREPGAAMVVTTQDLAGTIGGGHLEYEAIRLAREALARDVPGSPWLVRFPLAARLGQCCGGVATLLFSVVTRDAAWLDVSIACQRAATPHALVCCIDGDSVTGKRLVVTADDVRGTLGAQALDSAAISEARARLALPRDDPRSRSAVVGIAGATLFVHVVDSDRFDMLVFGNGHVGRALVQVLGVLPVSVRWIDTREHDFPPMPPANVEVVATDAPEDEIAAAPRGAYVVVMTHSHPLDFDIVEAALGRDDWRYVGMIGSKAKRAQFERRLLARGMAPDALARLTCPIGQRIVRGKDPGTIAVAVAAEMLAVRESARATMSDDDASPRGRSRG